MQSMKYLLAIALLLGTIPSASNADDEKEKAGALDEKRVEHKEVGPKDDARKRALAEQIKQKIVETEKRAEKLLSVGNEVEAKVNYEAIKKMREALANVLSDESERAREAGLFPLQLEEQLLLETLGTDHPKVQELRKRMELIRKELAKQNLANQERAESARSAEREADGNEGQRRLQHLRAAAENLAAAGLREQAEQIRKQIEMAETGNRGAGELRELHAQIRQLNERVERLEGMIRRLVEQQEQKR